MIHDTDSPKKRWPSDAPEKVDPSQGTFTAIILMVIAAILLAVVMRGERPTIQTSEDPTTTTELPLSPLPTTVSTISDIYFPADVVPPLQPAVRVDPPIQVEQAAPFDCESYVNSLPYERDNMVPVREAYQVTASCIGWDEYTRNKWENFIVYDVIPKESAGCWNIRGGATVSGMCYVSKQGNKEDTGFGQLIRVWYEYPNGILCKSHGVCSSEWILESPWNSMRALLWAIEFDGRRPWCFNAWAMGYHPTCKTMPRYWP